LKKMHGGRLIWALTTTLLVASGLQLGLTLARATSPPSPSPEAPGYWVVAETGAVYGFGDAPRLGSASVRLAHPVVGMRPTPSGQGYWLVASDGGIFSFGDAPFLGSAGAMRLNQPIVGMAVTPSGRGYWLVASDGGIFSFGDARFYGSTGAMRLNRGIVGMAATPSGRGYWMVASDGGIFSFGDARFYGSTGAMRLNRGIVGMAATPSGRGYWMVASDGGIFSFGDASFYGSAAGWTSRATGIAALPLRPVRQDGSAGPPLSGGSTTPTESTTTTGSTTSTTTPTTTTGPPAGAFQIGLIGDTGYNADQQSQLLAVRAQMATFPLAFVVHDGDIDKAGGACSDGALRSVLKVFNGFAAPFIYTPGDNEWQDCSDPRGRLDAIRRTFFSTDKSLGQRRLTLERQPTYVENARWSGGGVYFATLNVPGPIGGMDNTAEVAWLNATFDLAEATGSPGVMIIWQDNPFDGTADQTLVATLKNRTVAFARPVVLVHGETHSYSLSHPWEDVANFTRLETYADLQADHWVRVTVDPGSVKVFSFTTERTGSTTSSDT
jgi:hypothetical protein